MKRWILGLAAILIAVPLAADLFTSVRITINHELSATRGLSTPTDLFRYTIARRLSDGVGEARCNQVLSVSRALSAATEENIDLVGSETNPLGNIVDLTRIRMMYVENVATGALEVGGTVASAFEGWISSGATITVQASGVLLLIAPQSGWIATDSESDILRLYSPEGTAYKLWIVGANE